MKKASRPTVEWGIELPNHDGQVIFIEQELLTRLADQGPWDSQFGRPITLLPHEGEALIREGLVVRETRHGYHGTSKLRDLLAEWGWL